ncbi:DUF433 domain-containing protein [uncultured Jatrophihabitans sp.]|uniref:DUF433 domain-containing protein n=1 Tax=uncultured Jatrophihabitans sp. TaxID=1610747 RepID=UPI0035CA239E
MTTLAPEKSAIDKFDAPLYSIAEAARYLAMNDGTFRTWARGYTTHIGARTVTGKPIITDLGHPGQRGPAIPFVGLAEGYALAAIRRAGVPLQRIRPALDRLSEEIGLAHALASERLYTDGAEVLYDYAQTADGEEAEALEELTVVRHGQRVFAEVVRDYLKRVTWGSDGYAVVIPLPGYAQSEVIADIRRGFGQPTFRHGGARLEDVLALFYAGESAATVADEFGLTQIEVEDAIRVDKKS